jgi:molecular chaperone HtpG
MMIEDYIPAGIRQKIVSSSIGAGTLSIARTLHDHFRLSGLPFFREYTDHTFQHSIDVFKSACDMVSDAAFDIVSADDLSVLLLSCLIHDSGLHITEDVFLGLTDPSNSKIAIPEFDKKAWPELWADFLAEAQRFNDKKLISLFGDQEPVREPPRSAIELSQRDKLLIGEFLRRHHPRFGHEFIVGAVPDARKSKFEFPEIDDRIKDIIGLIGRSHGLDLRNTFDYIEKHYDLRDYNRIHIVYLTVLIRIADYLQIQSARAPALFGKLHTIKSPFSLGEWKLHQSIENITTSAMDPEAVSVLANPKSVHEYLRFEGWMRGFQTEIDKSWAILGEVYGRFTREALNKLQLNIRRIRSNIEDKTTLQKKSGFVPEPIRFSVSEPELLRLLMEPLYGDNPTYGLRELTQNAADSIIELEHALKTPMSAMLDRADLTNDIEVEIVGGPDWTFTIKDRGSGMTLDTIKNYFLKAGASFRNSELWKHDFTDSGGKSHVARTGRFGVGALSAYLIGDKVHIFMTPEKMSFQLFRTFREALS